MKELFLTIDALKALDSNYEVIMNFLSRPDKHWELIDITLRHHINKLGSNATRAELITKYEQSLNLLYDQWWGNTYPLHDVHFHRNFVDYVNCPYSSLTEVIDCMNKILTGRSTGA